MRENINDARRREHERDLQRLRELRPIDDDFMRQLFKDNTPLAEMVLRIITGKHDLTLIEEETQKDYKRLVGARSLCLDVYAKDSEGRLYDLEVQRADSGARPHRARYHSSAMDIENLDAGQDFEALPITYTIFITENDIYHKGAPIYWIERVNLQTGKPFDDGEHILYVNGAFRDYSDIGRLMHDFGCSNPDDMFYEPLANRARYYKENPKGVSQMCKILEDMRNEAAAEAATEATIQANVLAIQNIMDSFAVDAEKAMDALKIPASERPAYAARL